jgi:hypothetical protein
MLHPAPQNHLLAALAAYLLNVRDTLDPDLKKGSLKQGHALFDAGESPTPVLFSLSGAASILAKVGRRVIEAAMVSREDAVGLSSIAGTNGITLCEIIFNCATEFFGRLALVFTRKRLHYAPQRLANKLLLTREHRHSNPTAITNISLTRPIGGARNAGAQSRLEFRRARWDRSGHCRITVLRRSQIEQTVCSCHTFIHHEKNISPVGAPP